MNFRKRGVEEPEISLIPFIDVLLVILIFLMLSTTFSKFNELQLNLPTADTQAQKDYPSEVRVKIASDGQMWFNDQPQGAGKGRDFLSMRLLEVAQGNAEAVVVISADALASHQSVVQVMEAAQQAGLARVTFSAQPSGQ